MKMHNIRQSRSSARGAACSVAMTAFILSCAAGRVTAQIDTELKPTDVLRKEHEIIRKMADAAKQDAGKIRKSGAVETERIAKLHDFFKNFADRCHHAKEEDELFPVLREIDVDPVVIDLLIKQHEEGRILLEGIEEVLTGLTDERDKTQTQALGRYLFEYAQLMDRHIRIENEYLWPQAAERLSDHQKQSIAKAFHQIETEDLGKGFHEKYHALAMDVLGKQNSP